jgi:hypothetical protein
MPLFSDDLFLGSGATYMGTGNYAATAVFTGTISTTTLTVQYQQSGDPLVVGQYIVGSSVTANSYITASLGQNSSGLSQYTLSQSSTVSSNTTMYANGNALLGDPSPMSLGVGPLGRIYMWDTIPQTLQAANIAASQTPAAAGNLTLTAGTSVVTATRSDGTTVYQLDVPRALSVTQVTAGTGRNFTVSGYDYYGQAMTELIASTSGSTISGNKAFYQIASIAVSNATTTAVTVGTTDKLGLPVRVIDGGYVVNAGWAGTAGFNAGTFAAADMTTPATNATGDVRGTYIPSSATNGSRRLVMAIAVPAIAVGPNSTRNGALGVTQA